MTLFDKSCTDSYLRSILTMALSCIVSEIKQDNSLKSRFIIPQLHLTSPLRYGRRTTVVFFCFKVAICLCYNVVQQILPKVQPAE